MTPEREAAHCDAMWIAIAQLAEEGPRTTNELLGRCICWGRLAPSTRRVYLLCALSEAEDLGLVTSRYERRDGARHRVFEVTALGRAEAADLVREERAG